VIEKQIIIPGAPKSGTTNLFFTLSKHSGISVPKEKEPHFLSLNPRKVADNVEWYLSLYNTGGIKIDASTSYLYSKNFVANVSKLVNDPRIIVILRDPAKRAFSQYKHMIKQVPKADKRDFSKIVRDLPVGSPCTLIEEENVYTNTSIKEGEIDGNYHDENYLSRYCNAPFKSHFEDPNWQYKYLQNSIYHVHTRRLVEEFGSGVKVIFFEEFLEEPFSQIEKILSFASLCHGDIEPSRIKNTTRAPRGPTTRLIKYVRNDTVLGDKIDHVTHCLRSLGLGNIIDYLRDEIIYHNPSFTRGDYYRTRELLSFEYEYWFETNPKLRTLWVY
jgi:hypothetical protein